MARAREGFEDSHDELGQASHGVGVNTALALFFSRFGVEELPLMIVISGPAVMIATFVAHGGTGSTR